MRKGNLIRLRAKWILPLGVLPVEVGEEFLRVIEDVRVEGKGGSPVGIIASFDVNASSTPTLRRRRMWIEIEEVIYCNAAERRALCKDRRGRG